MSASYVYFFIAYFLYFVHLFVCVCMFVSLSILIYLSVFRDRFSLLIS